MNKRKLDDNDMSIKKERITPNLEYEVINYINAPSLESITITAIITRLWMHMDLRDSIRLHLSNYSSGSYIDKEKDRSFYQMEEKMLSKLSVLSLPRLLKAKSSDFIRPIGFQIIKWIYVNEHYFGFENCIKQIDSLYWTMDGTIDKANTLMVLQLNGNGEEKNISCYYELACKYCLEDQVVHLWKQIPQYSKDKYYSKTLYAEYDDDHLVAYWTSIVKNELSEFLKIIKENDNLYDNNASIYEKMFTLSISQYNALSVKYFWSKLTEEERSNNIVKSLEKVIENIMNSIDFNYQNSNECTNILCFLLSQVQAKAHHRVTFQKHNKVILERLFFNWPWQKFLVPTINQMWDFLDQQVYVELLSRVGKEIKKGRTTEILLKMIWTNSPINFKQCFIQYIIKDNSGANVLFNLLIMNDQETIIFLLNDANDEEKKQIVFAMIQNENMFELVYLDKLSLVDMLIGETLSSECLINKFKENLVLEYGHRLCHCWILKGNWKMLKKFMDWCVTSSSQIDNLKNKVLDKFSITISLVCEDNFELLDKFMQWCFCSENEINQFKHYIGIERTSEIVKVLGYGGDWDLFEKFIKWCFLCDTYINRFKLNILKNIEDSIFSIIVHRYSFKFADKLLNWCLNSDEIKKFKNEFLLSNSGMDICERLVSNYEVYDREYNNWDLLKMLTKWYYPLEKKVINKFKRQVKRKTYMFAPEITYPSFSAKGKKQALFHLLDSFALDNNDDELGDQSDCSKSDKDFNFMDSDKRDCNDNSEDSNENSEVSNDNSENSNTADSNCSPSSEDSIWSTCSDAAALLSGLMDVDSECTDSDENCYESSEYDEDVVILLCEILNQVSNFSGENVQQNYENM